jgi:hypothetical protein
MNADLAEFEAARADRAKRTDYEGHHAERVRHEGTAADLARAYVDDHPELEARLGAYTLSELVGLVDTFRAQGNETRVAEIDAWLMAEFPPQHIGVIAEPERIDRHPNPLADAPRHTEATR